MHITQQDIDFLTTLGTKLQVAFTNLEAAGSMLTETELPDAFFDGILTEKLVTLSDGVSDAIDLVALLAKRALEQKSMADYDALAAAARSQARKIASGEAFGFPPKPASESGCDGCPVPDCDSRQ